MAAVEFALIVPIMLLAYLGAVDVTQGLMADRKLTHLAGTLGDLVAQDKLGEITNEDIEGYFEASTALMQPYSAAATPMRISIVAVDGDGDAEVTESVANNGVTALARGTSIDLPGDMAELAADRCVVVAEGWYDYSPMFSYVFQADVPLYQRSIHIPRFESDGCEADGLIDVDIDLDDDGVDVGVGVDPGGEGIDVCAGYSGGHGQGNNCNEENNSWGNGNGQGGGITNNLGRDNGGGGGNNRGGGNDRGGGNGRGGGNNHGGGGGGLNWDGW